MKRAGSIPMGVCYDETCQAAVDKQDSVDLSLNHRLYQIKDTAVSFGQDLLWLGLGVMRSLL